MSRPARIFVGTAGWSVPKPFASRFPAEGSHLERYAARLNAAEINTSFYRPHRRQTYERWAASVPPDFRFSVKLPRTITHAPTFTGHGNRADQFAEQALGLGAKLGLVLVQFPPSRAFDPSAGALFDQLAAALACTIACEPRHASWFAPAAERLLASHRIARVAADPAKVPDAALPGGWPGLRYHRLHGSPRVYHSSYDEPALTVLKDTLAGADTETWCIFDNTASHAATGNALALTDRMVKSGI